MPVHAIPNSCRDNDHIVMTQNQKNQQWNQTDDPDIYEHPVF